MKTKDIIVLRRIQKDRTGADRTDYYDGVVRTQSFGPNYIAGKGIDAAKVYANEAEATRDLLAEPDLLRDFAVATVGLWLPQPGEFVVYQARSNISGAVANVRLAEVLKVTQRGYVHIKRVAEAFGRYEPDLFVQKARSNFLTSIRPATEADLATLPAWNDMRRAQELGRQITAQERAARG